MTTDDHKSNDISFYDEAIGHFGSRCEMPKVE